jgi:hypothetical protein
VGVYTFTQLLARVRYQSDQAGFTARHPDATLAIELNASIRDLRAKLYAAGSPAVLSHMTLTVEAGASTGYPGTLLVPKTTGWGSTVAVAAIKQLRAYVDSQWCILDEVGLADIVDWEASGVGKPEAYCVIGQDAESGTANLARLRALILPATDADYSFGLTYLAAWPEYTYSAGTDEFANDIPFAEWCVADMCRKIFVRDERPDRVAQFEAECAKREAEIIHAHRNLSKRGPYRRRPVTRTLTFNRD